MRTALRGRGTRHDDSRHDGSRHDDLVHEDLRGRSRRPEPAHLTLRTEPHPLG
jgi:hypothetical protein